LTRLLTRDTALLHPTTDPAEGAVEVYPDLECLNALAPADDKGDYELGLLTPAKLFAFVLERSAVLAIRAIGKEGPVRVLFSATAVRALAAGQVPASGPGGPSKQ
jgi:hypothetical protein